MCVFSVCQEVKNNPVFVITEEDLKQASVLTESSAPSKKEKREAERRKKATGWSGLLHHCESLRADTLTSSVCVCVSIRGQRQREVRRRRQRQRDPHPQNQEEGQEGRGQRRGNRSDAAK